MGQGPRYVRRHSWGGRWVRTHNDQLNSVCLRCVQNSFWQEICARYKFWRRR